MTALETCKQVHSKLHMHTNIIVENFQFSLKYIFPLSKHVFIYRILWMTDKDDV